MTALEAGLAALATWRITHLLHAEDGPADLIARLRAAIGTGWIGEAMACFYCLSVWIAAPLAIAVGEGWLETLVAWPALSGAAILLERITARPEEARSEAAAAEPAAALWREDPPGEAS